MNYNRNILYSIYAVCMFDFPYSHAPHLSFFVVVVACLLVVLSCSLLEFSLKCKAAK